MNDLYSTGGKRVQPAPPYGRMAARVLLVLLAAAVVLLNLFAHVFPIVRYHGSGMEPALKNRQLLVLVKTDEARQGDIIAFYYNNKVLVRRVICEGGHTLRMDETGAVWVDEAPLDEPYVTAPSLGQCSVSFPYSVPVGQYFVMGDDRAIAMDSRLAEIGPVPADRILGKVLFVI